MGYIYPTRFVHKNSKIAILLILQNLLHNHFLDTLYCFCAVFTTMSAKNFGAAENFLASMFSDIPESDLSESKDECHPLLSDGEQCSTEDENSETKKHNDFSDNESEVIPASFRACVWSKITNDF